VTSSNTNGKEESLQIVILNVSKFSNFLT
jgi:hypothetical protein